MTAPERIWATCNGSDPSGNWWHCRELAVGVEYILASHVTDMIRQAVEAEREACAKVAEREAMWSIIEARRGSARTWMAEMSADDPERPLFDGAARECASIAAAIRARKGE